MATELEQLDVSDDQKYQAEVWRDSQRHNLTTITLTRYAISWENSKKGLVFEISKVTGAKPSLTDPTSISIQVFNPTTKKFKIYNFWFLTIELAIHWFQLIRKFARDSLDNRHIAIILNPISGNKSGRKAWQNKFQPALSYSGIRYSLFETTNSDYVENWVKSRDISAFSDIVCIGGDGTLHQLITAINKYHKAALDIISFGILPTGSRNALACEIGSRRTTEGIMNIIKAKTFKADIMQVRLESDVLLATCAISWGIVSDICEEAQHYRFLGAFRYTAVGIKKFIQKWKKYKANVSYEDQAGDVVNLESDFNYIAITNHRIQNISNSEILTPNARINDGFLDLQMMEWGNKWRMIKTLNKTMQTGSHISLPYIKDTKTRIVSLEPRSPLVYNVDGEIYKGSSIQIQIMPEMISMLGQLEVKKLE